MHQNNENGIYAAMGREKDFKKNIPFLGHTCGAVS